MAISYLCKINGTDLTFYLKAPGGYKVSKLKLWSDADRNMAGDLKADYIGTYAKIFLEFRSLTQSEMATVLALLELPSFTVAWYDAKTDAVKSGTFYAGDYTPALYHISNNRYEPFNVNLIAFNKL